MRIGVVGIIHFVADAPEEDAGMTAVAAHHIGHIAVNPFLKVSVRAFEARFPLIPAFQPLALRKLPFVACLVHHQHSFFVADVVECRRVRIVAHTQGIDADGFQLTHTTSPHLGRHGSSQHTSIVMHTDTFHLHPFAVERKAFFRRELQRAQTCFYCRFIAVAEFCGERI